MGKKINLGDKLTAKKQRYMNALVTGNLTDAQLTDIVNAVHSVEYIYNVLSGQILLPSLTESADSDWGMVYEWLAGSYRNVEKADKILDGVAGVNVQAAEAEKAEALKARDKAEAEKVEALKAKDKALKIFKDFRSVFESL